MLGLGWCTKPPASSVPKIKIWSISAASADGAQSTLNMKVAARLVGAIRDQRRWRWRWRWRWNTRSPQLMVAPTKHSTANHLRIKKIISLTTFNRRNFEEIFFLNLTLAGRIVQRLRYSQGLNNASMHTAQVSSSLKTIELTSPVYSAPHCQKARRVN